MGHQFAASDACPCGMRSTFSAALGSLGRRWAVCVAALGITFLVPDSFASPPRDPPETYTWAAQFGTAGNDLGRNVAADSLGNAYVVGYTSGAFLGHEHAGGFDGFLAKFDPDGDQVWVKQFGVSADDRALGLAVYPTPAGNLGDAFIAGITFGAFPNQVNAGGESDAYLARFSPEGDLLWFTQYGTTGTDQSYRVVVHPDDPDTQTPGWLYVSGSTLGAFPGQQSFGNFDAFLAKFRLTGQLLWVRQFGTPGGDSAPALAVDAQGNAYVGVYTTSVFPGQQEFGAVDTVLLKYNPAGNQLWVRQFGAISGGGAGGGATIVTDLAVDDVNNLYVSGHTTGTLTGQSGGGGMDAYLAKYTPDGDQIWITQFGAPGGVENFASGVAVAGSFLYLTGHTYGAFPGQSSHGGADAFLAKYTIDGEQIWVEQFGTNTHDFARSIAMIPSADFDACGHADGTHRGETPKSSSVDLLITGRTIGTFPGQVSNGLHDAFLTRWTVCAAEEPRMPKLPGDLNGNGVVDVFDLLILLAEWGPCPPAEPGTDGCEADLNDDGTVDVFDLLILLANWG